MLLIGIAGCSQATPPAQKDIPHEPRALSLDAAPKVDLKMDLDASPPGIDGAPRSASPCEGLARDLAAAKILELTALPTCTLDELTQGFPALAAAEDNPGELGRDHQQLQWRALESGIAGETFRVWHDDGRVVALELEGLDIDDWTPIRDQLGTPDAKLDYTRDVVRQPGGLWVFAARGLAVFTALDEEDVYRVVVFAPTTVKDYESKLGMGLRPARERP